MKRTKTKRKRKRKPKKEKRKNALQTVRKKLVVLEEVLNKNFSLLENIKVGQFVQPFF